MEKTWLAEQAAEKEKLKLEQLKKEIRQERSMEELMNLKDSKKVNKIDWMYSGSSSSVKQIQDDYLLGKKKVDLNPISFEPANQSLTQSKSEITSLLSNKLDLESKSREDPLFTIKKKELEHLKKTVSQKFQSNASLSKTRSSRTFNDICPRVQKQHKK